MIVEFLKNIFSFDSDYPLLFTQFYFWAFFAIVFAVFSLFNSKVLLRNSFIFFVSVFFYYKTSGWATLILVFATLLNFWVGLSIEKSETERARRIKLVLGLFLNLGILCYFKYAYFFADMIHDLFGLNIPIVNVFAEIGNVFAGKDTFTVDKIILPVGISFYTFQCISYIMDVYRDKVEPVHNILNFGFYVTFFPQLVAGPIVRASAFIPQIYKKFFLSRRQFGIAVFWILNGLAKKIILSDYLAVNFVDRVFENPLLYTGFENLMALFAYSLQVYADFSGYTDIAIGVAMLMGFYLPKNFNSPYKATNPGEFWKRWHMSLSKWLQDYLYIPLGGNRTASFGTYACILTISLIGTILSGSIWVAIALLVLTVIVTIYCHKSPEKQRSLTSNMNRMNTMLLGGLWHGASWNFVIWGALNGAGMIVYKVWAKMNWNIKMLLMTLLMGSLWVAYALLSAPIWNLFFVWGMALWIGTFVRYLYWWYERILMKRDKLLTPNTFKTIKTFKILESAWAILQTFVFITFTRLFFRSSSNLDPATASQEAWETAINMINQIGGAWDNSIIPDFLWEYRYVVILFVLGMVVHWLPNRVKRWYRIHFCQLPIWAIIVITVAAIIGVYQFVTADLQAFIYFQF